jgi:hypothetical protein
MEEGWYICLVRRVNDACMSFPVSGRFGAPPAPASAHSLRRHRDALRPEVT